MLIIGHRGAAGLAPENTLAAFEAGFQAGADMLELDVRLTADKQLVVIHDRSLARTHHRRENISRLTFAELQTLTADKPVPLATEVFDQFFGRIFLNIELKSRGSAEVLLNLLEDHYIKRPKDWDSFMISSFKGMELRKIRQRALRANLALLHDQNPFAFVAYQRALNLTAVGFHRLYLNRFALEIAKRAGLFIYVYTVNRPAAIDHLEAQSVGGIVTNYPDKCLEYLERHHA